MKKVTSKVALSLSLSALSVIDESEFNGFNKAEVLDKLNKMIAQLDKRNEGEKAQTPQQKENEGFKAEILSVLGSGEHMTATEIGKRLSVELSNQRISALLRLLKLEGKVDKETAKGKTLFFAA